MLELPFVLTAGLLGSSHCIGMCGGFALTIGAGFTSARKNFRRQLIYTTGRLFTYSVLGATAGFAGMRLATFSDRFVNAPAVLALVAGTFLIWQGLVTAGVMRKKTVGASSAPCLTGSLFCAYLNDPSWTSVFTAGLLTGLLPCGLLYGMLALAVSTGNMLYGGLMMALFGIGTMPAMVLAGMSGSLLGVGRRQQLLKVAAWCVVFTGVITVARGCGFLTLLHPAGGGGCPACG